MDAVALGAVLCCADWANKFVGRAPNAVDAPKPLVPEAGYAPIPPNGGLFV